MFLLYFYGALIALQVEIYKYRVFHIFCDLLMRNKAMHNCSYQPRSKARFLLILLKSCYNELLILKVCNINRIKLGPVVQVFNTPGHVNRTVSTLEHHINRTRLVTSAKRVKIYKETIQDRISNIV